MTAEPHHGELDILNAISEDTTKMAGALQIAHLDEGNILHLAVTGPLDKFDTQVLKADASASHCIVCLDRH